MENSDAPNDLTAAERYRLLQAEELLFAFGYVKDEVTGEFYKPDAKTAE